MSLQFLKSQISKHTLAEKMGMHKQNVIESKQECLKEVGRSQAKLSVKEKRLIASTKNKEEVLLRKTKQIAKKKAGGISQKKTQNV